MRAVLVAAALLLVAVSLSGQRFRNLFTSSTIQAHAGIGSSLAPSVRLLRNPPSVEAAAFSLHRQRATGRGGSWACYLAVGALLGSAVLHRRGFRGRADIDAAPSRTAVLAVSGRVSVSDANPSEDPGMAGRLLRQVQSSAAGQGITAHVVSCVLAAALACTPSTVLPAWADDKRVIGEFATSGLVFKDTLRVEAFTDPKVPGVQLFLSDFFQPVTEKLAKGDVFSDPANVGLSCSRTGRVVVPATVSQKLDGEEVLSDSKNLFFKSVKVRRLVDKKSGNLVYAAYSQRVNTSGDSNSSRFRNSLCAVPVDEFEAAQ